MTDPAHRIERVSARRVWDSRGRPTVEAEVHLPGGVTGRATAPAGASTGRGEALDLRDGGTAFGGYDVTRALRQVRDTIAPALRGRDVTGQLKVGSFSRSERMAKWNEVLRIEEALGAAAVFAGARPLPRPPVT